MKETIEKLWESKRKINSVSKSREAYEIVGSVISLLDNGKVRVSEKIDGEWRTNEWIKKAILLYFLVEKTYTLTTGCIRYFDKILPKNLPKLHSHFRNVPPGMIRRGAYISDGVVMMPAFVNIGAYVGEKTMIDTWSTIGSCAQIGSNVHISGGVGIGGVLEPVNAHPVIIEDNCFIGARSEIAEGVIVGSNSVISMGVFIGKSTKIYDRTSGVVSYGRVPANSVVVPGSLTKDANHGLNCAVIVKRVDGVTRSKTSINELLRC